MTNSVLVGFDVIAEIVSGGFVAREYDCDIQTLEPPGETVDLGEINADVLNLPRVEIVMGTDVDDARRVRLMSGVHNISQRKVGDHGRVRVTLDVPVGMLDAVTSRSRLWARSRIRAQTGVLLHQSKQQWQELAAVLNAESWVAGRIICESPRWVLISAAEELSTDDVVGRLMELRISGAITQDISYRAWSGSAASGTCVTTGTIDTGAIAEVKNADPRLTTGACHALLAAVGIWVRCDSISLTEAYDSQGNASRTLRVSISRSEIDRLVGVPRRFIWEGQQLKVPFSKAADAMDRRTPKHANANATNANSPRSVPSTKRSHVTGSTPVRKTKSKVDEAQEENFVEVPEESGDVADEADNPMEDSSGNDSPETVLGIGDLVRAPKLSADGSSGDEETLRLVERDEFGWRAVRADMQSARVRHRSGDSPGWIVEQPLRKPGQWTKWFGISKHGDAAEQEAILCKDQWNAEDFKAVLVDAIEGPEESSTPRYCLAKARKCGALEEAGLLAEDSREGRAEWARRHAAGNFQNSVQHEVEDDDGELMAGVTDGEGPSVESSH